MNEFITVFIFWAQMGKWDHSQVLLSFRAVFFFSDFIFLLLNAVLYFDFLTETSLISAMTLKTDSFV